MYTLLYSKKYTVREREKDRRKHGKKKCTHIYTDPYLLSARYPGIRSDQNIKELFPTSCKLT